MATLSEEFILRKSRAKKLEHVKTLNCWGCKLQDISILEKTNNLEVVGLSGNCIKSLQEFKFCKQLRELYVRRNCLCDLAEVHHLARLGGLQVLWLSENPLSATPGYRRYVVKALPGLLTLDNKDITEEERESVSELSYEEILDPVDASSETEQTSDHQGKDTSNICQAILCLLDELDSESLLTVKNKTEQLLTAKNKTKLLSMAKNETKQLLME